MAKLNKNDIIEIVSDKARLSKKDAKAAVDSTLELMKNILLQGGEINLTNFGTFQAKKRVARVGTDPKSHKKIEIKPTTTVSFKVAKSFKKDLNN